jgi:putative ABC transport system ATP-binding protein
MSARSAYVGFHEVHKSFRRGEQQISVLEGIDLEVAGGEFIALMGPSGSGKSSLLNLAAGLDRPTSGTVTVAGIQPAALGDNEVCRWRSRHVGFVFQRYHLLAALDAAQNVEVPLLLLKLPRGERNRRVRTALELVGLHDRAHHFPHQLSGGQEQRVAIARAIVADPKLILADEPTGDLDSRSAGEILDLLGLLNQQLRKTILMVTHDPKAARRAQRVLHLEKGFIYQGEIQ